LHPDRDLWNRSFEVYSNRPDKEWSLTDCMSFLVIQDRDLTEALTADRHFEQAGFTILLK
jgi:predicted nucleic acid-binding protein